MATDSYSNVLLPWGTADTAWDVRVRPRRFGRIDGGLAGRSDDSESGFLHNGWQGRYCEVESTARFMSLFSERHDDYALRIDAAGWTAWLGGIRLNRGVLASVREAFIHHQLRHAYLPQPSLALFADRLGVLASLPAMVERFGGAAMHDFMEAACCSERFHHRELLRLGVGAEAFLDQFTVCRAMIRSGRGEAAAVARCLDELTARMPEQTNLLLYRAWRAWLEGRRDEAETHAAVLVDRGAELTADCLEAACALHAQGRGAETVDVLERCLGVPFDR